MDHSKVDEDFQDALDENIPEASIPLPYQFEPLNEAQIHHQMDQPRRPLALQNRLHTTDW